MSWGSDLLGVPALVYNTILGLKLAQKFEDIPSSMWKMIEAVRHLTRIDIIPLINTQVMIWVLFPDLILRLTCLNSPCDAKLQSDVPRILESTPSIAELSGRWQMGKAWKGFQILCRLFFAVPSLRGLPVPVWPWMAMSQTIWSINKHFAGSSIFYCQIV